MSELQIIIEALNSLGEDAKTAFIVWIAMKYGITGLASALTAGCFIAFFVLVGTTVRFCVREYWKHNSN